MEPILLSASYSDTLDSKAAHFHDCHQIILILHGQAEFCINGNRHPAKAGDIAIFSRYENHSVHVFSEEYERFVLHIDPASINRKSIVYSLLTDRPISFCNVINISSRMDQITSVFKRILLEHSGSSKLANEMEQLLLQQLLITIYRCTSINFINTNLSFE